MGTDLTAQTGLSMPCEYCCTEEGHRCPSANDDIERLQKLVLEWETTFRNKAEESSAHADEALRLQQETLEQARLLGAGSEREARLMARIAELERHE